MKHLTLTVQIKVDEEEWSGDPVKLMETLANNIETDITEYGKVLDHLKEYGYEVMIMDRKEGPWVR